MLIKVARQPRPFLMGWAVVVAALAAFSWIDSDVPRAVLGFLWILPSFGVSAATRNPFPAELTVRDGAFATLPDVRPLMVTAGGTALTALLVSVRADGLSRGDPSPMPLALIVLLAALVFVQWCVSWRPPRAVLRPDGIHHRQQFGSVLIPWDAAPVVAAGRTFAGVRLDLGRPDLVIRRGWQPRGRGATADLWFSVDHRFLSGLIGDYVTRPEHRAAIGTAGELQRLLAAYGS